MRRISPRITLHTYPASRVREKCSQLVCDVLERERDRHIPVLLLLSGGSALACMNISPLCRGSVGAVSMLDDRVTRDPQNNNFLQFTTTDFYRNCVQVGWEIIPTVPERGEGAAALARRIARAWRAWLAAHPSAKIVAVLGMGEDGHTAGLLPGARGTRFEEALFSEGSSAWVAPLLLPKGITVHPRRITATAAFLQKKVDHATLYAVGSKKCRRLRQALNEKACRRARLPVCVIHSMREVQVVTDCALLPQRARE